MKFNLNVSSSPNAHKPTWVWKKKDEIVIHRFEIGAIIFLPISTFLSQLILSKMGHYCHIDFAVNHFQNLTHHHEWYFSTSKTSEVDVLKHRFHKRRKIHIVYDNLIFKMKAAIFVQ